MHFSRIILTNAHDDESELSKERNKTNTRAQGSELNKPTKRTTNLTYPIAQINQHTLISVKYQTPLLSGRFLDCCCGDDYDNDEADDSRCPGRASRPDDDNKFILHRPTKWWMRKRARNYAQQTKGTKNNNPGTTTLRKGTHHRLDDYPCQWIVPTPPAGVIENSAPRIYRRGEPEPPLTLV